MTHDETTPPNDAKPSPKGCFRILLVEDHGDTLDAVARLLRSGGHEVTSAKSCAEARQLAKLKQFDLLLADISLADGDGLDLLAAVRPARGVALTAMCGEDVVTRSQRAGFSAHLVKPIGFDVLERTIEQTMRGG
jgi:CheY-like chemotaxis protein